MAKGDYLTKPRFGKPADELEQKAADWLEANCGYEGQDVMKSLAKLLRQMSNRDAIKRLADEVYRCEHGTMLIDIAAAIRALAEQPRSEVTIAPAARGEGSPEENGQ